MDNEHSKGKPPPRREPVGWTGSRSLPLRAIVVTAIVTAAVANSLSWLGKLAEYLAAHLRWVG